MLHVEHLARTVALRYLFLVNAQVLTGELALKFAWKAQLYAPCRQAEGPR